LHKPFVPEKFLGSGEIPGDKVYFAGVKILIPGRNFYSQKQKNMILLIKKDSYIWTAVTLLLFL